MKAFFAALRRVPHASARVLELGISVKGRYGEMGVYKKINTVLAIAEGKRCVLKCAVRMECIVFCLICITFLLFVMRHLN